LDLIKHFWYLINVERQKETVTVSALMSQVTPLKTIRTTFVSVIFRQLCKHMSKGEQIRDVILISLHKEENGN
jgi:hypothetical protein